MGAIKKYITVLLFLSVQSAFGQENSFTRYDLKDGLAGSTVYTMTQDKEDFLWFGTETGLSRFDGTNFKNFTTTDGLPDNEILEIYCDSKNRVWLAPFKASIAYILNGRIHNQLNDSVLSKVKLPGNILSFAEDANGDLAILGRTFVFVIKWDGEIRYISNAHQYQGVLNSSITQKEGGGFLLFTSKGLVSLVRDEMKFIEVFDVDYSHYASSKITEKYLAYRDGMRYEKIQLLKQKKEVKFPVLNGMLKVNLVSDSILSFNTRNGAFLYNPHTPERPVSVFLKDKSISYAYRDNERNYWFCTLGQGVYKLNSDDFHTIVMYEDNKRQAGVNSITSNNGYVYCGTSLNSYHKIKLGKELFDKRYFNIKYGGELSPVKDLIVCSNGDIILGSGVLLSRLDSFGNNEKGLQTLAIKRLQLFGQKLTVASSGSVLNLDPFTFKILDTIWKERAITVLVKDSNYFIGTLNGLVSVNSHKKIEYLGDSIPILKSRIADLTEDKNGTIWVGTFGNGVVGFKNGKLVKWITMNDGLSANICRSIFVHNNFLWVGTDKGLNKIDISDPDFKVVSYFVEDGLPSDNIDAIYVEDSVIYLGTPAGLTYFKEKDISSYSTCSLRWTEMEINGSSSFPDSNSINLPPGKWNIRFGFVGISFKSNGDVNYRYRLIGLDTLWQTTNSTFLTYPSLPSGSYELQIVAYNKYGVKSNVLIYKFVIQQYYWETVWFKVLIAFLVLFIVYFILLFSIKFIRKREQEKTRINSLISELEQLALKSQMNPHFIFNSLNSIQQYVMDKDVTGANKFISGFSKLIRQTLDFSSRQKIGLDEELGYLSNYLELERTRLEGVFKYSIEVAPDLDLNGYFLPPMILQPFVENSVRHGVRYRKDSKGVIDIKVTVNDELIYFVIQDNGVGRKKSADFKRALPIIYQSKGMTLTAKRVELLNNNSKEKMQVVIEDAYPEDSEFPGTRVVVTIPSDLE